MPLSEAIGCELQPFTIFTDPTSPLPDLMPSKSKKTKKDEEFSLIPREKLLELYAALLRCTMLERFVATNVLALRSPMRAGPAAAAAACVELKAGDYLAASGRDILPPFVEGRGLSMILASMRVPAAQQRARFTAQVREAMTAARRSRTHGSRKIAVIFGRPAAGRQWQAMLHEATNSRLPILFVCNEQSHGRSLKPTRYLPAITVDRDDVVALYRVVSEGMAHARRGNGPTLIECIPWRHAGKHDAPDAIAKLEAYLAQKGISGARRKTSVTTKFEMELETCKRALRR